MAIAEEAINRYGSENVNPIISRDGDIVELIECGMDDKLIQLLICDDATLREVSDGDLKKFFKVRHLYKALTGKSNGYILTIFNVHRFHGLAIGLRTNIDTAIWRTPPTNPYDRSVVKRFVGEDGLQDLEYVESLRIDNPEWNSVSVFTSRIWKGLLILPMASQNHLKEIDVKRSDVQVGFTLGDYITRIGGMKR